MNSTVKNKIQNLWKQNYSPFYFWSQYVALLLRKAKKEHDPNRWFKRKQRERNRIEGGIGHGKEHFDLDRIRYEGRAGSEMWVRLGVLGMNLKTAMKKAWKQNIKSDR